MAPAASYPVSASVFPPFAPDAPAVAAVCTDEAGTMPPGVRFLSKPVSMADLLDLIPALVAQTLSSNTCLLVLQPPGVASAPNHYRVPMTYTNSSRTLTLGAPLSLVAPTSCPGVQTTDTYTYSGTVVIGEPLTITPAAS